MEVGRYPRPIHSWHRKQSGSLVGTGSLLGLFLARSQGQSSATTDDELIHVATDTKRIGPLCVRVGDFLAAWRGGHSIHKVVTYIVIRVYDRARKYKTCGWMKSGKRRREALKPTTCCISLLVCRRPPRREQITVAGSVASWSRLSIFHTFQQKHLTHYFTLWRGLIEIDSFVENENKKDQCLPAHTALHCWV